MNKETTLRPHQKRIRDLNPAKILLCWAPRTGKSKAGEDWINHPSRGMRTYVVCLKKNKKEWLSRAPDAVVYTKEEFKKHFEDILKDKPTAILVDECHHFHGKAFIAKNRSQLTTCLYTLVKKFPNMQYMGLTGTPLTNDPSSIHTALLYIGKYIDWKQFQQKFYELKYMPYLAYPAWFPTNNWRGMANELLKEYTDIVSLHDCVEYLPETISEVLEVKTKPKKYEDNEEYHWTISHKHEQTEKYKIIKDLPYRKVILVCHYIDQMDELEKKLKNIKPTYKVNGQTKDQEGTIAKAQKEDDCYLIVQAKMGESWDGYMFDAMFFVSMGHTVRDHTQMVSRLHTVQPEYMKPTIYTYMIGGKWDRKIYDSIMREEDFNPHKHHD